MPILFGRPIPASHATICPHLTALAGSSVESDIAIEENLRLDNRVSEARAERFLNHSKTVTGPDDITIQLDTQARKNAWTDFADVTVNTNNVVIQRGFKTPPAPLPATTQVVTIMTLFKDLRDYLEPRVTKKQDGTGIGSPSEATGLDQWFEEHSGPDPSDDLRDGIAAAYRGVVRSQLKNSKAGRTEHAERVVWVGKLDEFEQHMGEGPQRWLEVFGLGHILYRNGAVPKAKRTDWFFLLRYTLESTSTVARPTVLDAGANPYYFPSEGTLPAESGGKTMILGDANDLGIQPLTEYIHNQRQVKSEDVLGVFKLPPPARPSLKLLDIRNAHRAARAAAPPNSAT